MSDVPTCRLCGGLRPAEAALCPRCARRVLRARPALSVPCPACFAAAGQACAFEGRGAGGRWVGFRRDERRVHWRRRWAAWRWRREGRP